MKPTEYFVHYFSKGAKITLWCEKAVCKETAKSVEVVGEPPVKSKVHTLRDKSEEESNEIFMNLKEKHPSVETMKLCLICGKLIQSGHYDNYNNPPDIPLLTGHGKKKTS